jgi:hypothetical protein
MGQDVADGFDMVEIHVGHTSLALTESINDGTPLSDC